MVEKKLNMGERLIALTLMPQHSNYVTRKLINGLENKLGPSGEELVECEMNVKGGQLQPNKNGELWNAKGNKEKNLSFGEKETDIICDALKELDKTEKLESKHFSLYEKFVIGVDTDGKIEKK